ncbi:MAG: RnfABCDGE type electron transport complex subunit D, partial [Clostridia bacterium]|nr:RnfABCDGE type electron transport complex subunit D [Clostridia bacterium]
GGLMLGAFFMATDYTTCPINKKGKLIFGVGCGLITFVIRVFGALPEGVSFSIILMNILVPHIENLSAAKPFGTLKEKKGKKEEKKA